MVRHSNDSACVRDREINQTGDSEWPEEMHSEQQTRRGIASPRKN